MWPRSFSASSVSSCSNFVLSSHVVMILPQSCLPAELLKTSQCAVKLRWGRLNRKSPIIREIQTSRGRLEGILLFNRTWRETGQYSDTPSPDGGTTGLASSGAEDRILREDSTSRTLRTRSFHQPLTSRVSDSEVTAKQHSQRWPLVHCMSLLMSSDLASEWQRFEGSRVHHVRAKIKRLSEQYLRVLHAILLEIAL